MHILVTGGAGYIGSHTIIELVASGHSVEVIDNLLNGNAEAVKRAGEIAGETIPLHIFDLRDKKALSIILTASKFDAVIHFAGLKSVKESSENPLQYYRTNIDTTLTLIEAMAEHNIKKLVFSSSATVYGSAPIPYRETSIIGQGIASPYGQTKYMIEQILKDIVAADTSNEVTVLRYFNPIGAHQSGRIGEAPSGTPNNILPYITQVAAGKRDKLSIFGNDYDTIDGTGVRDYIHVVDVARGHVAALEYSHPGWEAYNLGSGKGTSVLELLHAFERASGQTIPYEIAPRRQGDLPAYYADATKAAAKLHWQTEISIDQACGDAWRWQTENPDGY